MGAGASTDVASNIESSTRKDLIHQARSLHIDLRTRVRDALDEADQKKASTSVQNPLNNASKPVSKMSLHELKGACGCLVNCLSAPTNAIDVADHIWKNFDIHVALCANA